MKKQSKMDACEMERLFKEHYALLCLVAFGILKDRDAAKDVVQDFLYPIGKKARLFPIPSPLKPTPLEQ